MKNKFSIALTLAVILAMLLTSLALADNFSVDNDVFSPGNQNSIDLSAAPGATVNTSAQLAVDFQGSKHLASGTTVSFSVDVAGTNLPAGYSVSNVSHTVPSDWNDPTDVFAAGSSSISFTAPSNPAIYVYTVKWNDTAETCVAGTTGDCLTGGSALTINLTVTAPPTPPPPSDTTKPSINCTVPDQTIWYADNVTVNCTASDSDSGLANPSDATFSLSTNVGAGTETNNASTGTKQVCDNTNNCADAGPYTFMVDKKAPVVNCGFADAFWHGSDVSIACTASDGGSGLANPADASFSLSTNVGSGVEDNNASTGTHSVADAVGNTAQAGPISGNMIDKKAPSVSCDSADSNWYATDQSVSCTATDAGSGPASQSLTLSTNVAAGTETDSAYTDSQPVSDAVGNSATAGPVGPFKIDKKAPQFASCDSPDGAWHNDNVTLNCSYTDGGSGPATQNVGLTTNVAAGAETNNALASANGAQACDAVGNCASSPADISGNMIDRKAPTNITFVGGIVDAGTYYFNFVPAAPTCTADDGGSGLASCVVTGYSTAIGGHTLTATATDNVGNSATASISYTVSAWTASGFYQPVDMNGVWNTVKNGSTVPLKFELFAGPTELKLTSYVQGFTAQAVACPTTGYVADAIEVTATGGTSLRFDTTGDQFVYNWQTPKKPGACYKVTMTALDGSTLTANFMLK